MTDILELLVQLLKVIDSDTTIEIVNELGTVQHINDITLFNDQIIDISTLNSGIYFIKILTTNRYFIQKIIKL